jgi:predicted phage tail protein
VVKTHHNASTFKPFDPAETIGDLNPATAAVAAAKPKKGGDKCGVFGTILLVAIAVAVTVVTAGAAAAAIGGYAETRTATSFA